MLLLHSSQLYILLHGCCSVVAYRDKSLVGGDAGRDFRVTLKNTANGEMFSEASEKNIFSVEAIRKEVEEGVEEVDPGTPGDKEKVTLANLKKGDYFGETALMVNIPRTTTVTTSQKALFVTIGKHEFHNFLRVCPDVNYRMKQVMKDRMMSKLSSMSIPFFTGISKEMFAEFAHNVEMHEMQKEEAVFKYGDKGDHFYLIIHGEVRIEMDKMVNVGNYSPKGKEDKPLRRSMSMDIGHLGPGKYFGEMALVDDDHTQRSASAICNKHSILLSVGREVFHKIFDYNPQALVEFRLRVQQDKAELKHILAHPRGMNMFETFLKKEVSANELQRTS